MAKITAPIMTDETGKRIAAALERMQSGGNISALGLTVQDGMLCMEDDG